MRKSVLFSVLTIVVLIPATLFLGTRLRGRWYYLTSTLVIVETMLPFFFAFETGHNCTMNYESVMGWGIVSELTDLKEKLHALDCIMKQYHSEEFPYDPAVAERTRILCLRIQERTGKRRAKRLRGRKNA